MSIRKVKRFAVKCDKCPDGLEEIFREKAAAIAFAKVHNWSVDHKGKTAICPRCHIDYLKEQSARLKEDIEEIEKRGEGG